MNREEVYHVDFYDLPKDLQDYCRKYWEENYLGDRQYVDLEHIVCDDRCPLEIAERFDEEVIKGSDKDIYIGWFW